MTRTNYCTNPSLEALADSATTAPLSFMYTNSVLADIAADLATIKAMHIDVLFSYQMGQGPTTASRPASPASDAEMLAYLDALNAAGLRTMLEVQFLGKLVVSGREDKVLSAGELAALAAYVDKWKTHPAVWGWYADDEGQVEYPIATRQQVYDTIKAAHPVGQVVECGFQLAAGAYSPDVHDVFAADVGPYVYFYDTVLGGCVSESTGLCTNSGLEAESLATFSSQLDAMKADLDAAGEATYFVVLGTFGEGHTRAMPPPLGISKMWSRAQDSGWDAYGVGYFLWKTSGGPNIGVGDSGYADRRDEISTISAGGQADGWGIFATCTNRKFSRVAALSGSGSHAQRMVLGPYAAGDSVNPGVGAHAPQGSFAAGEPCTISGTYRVNSVAVCTPWVLLQSYNSAYGVTGDEPVTLTADGAVHRFSVCIPSLAADTTAVGLWLGEANDWGAGAALSVDIDDVLIEKSAVLGSYFDGSYPGRWTGKPNASISIFDRTEFIFDSLDLNDGTVYGYCPGVELGARQKTWSERRSYTGAVAQYNVSEAASIAMKFPMRVQGTSLADLDAKVQAVNAKIDGCSSDSPRDLVFAGTTYQITTTPRVAYVLDEVAISLFRATLDLALNRMP